MYGEERIEIPEAVLLRAEQRRILLSRWLQRVRKISLSHTGHRSWYGTGHSVAHALSAAEGADVPGRVRTVFGPPESHAAWIDSNVCGDGAHLRVYSRADVAFECALSWACTVVCALSCTTCARRLRTAGDTKTLSKTLGHRSHGAPRPRGQFRRSISSWRESERLCRPSVRASPECFRRLFRFPDPVRRALHVLQLVVRGWSKQLGASN